MAVSHDDVAFSCGSSSLRKLMFREDRRASNSSFSLSLRMATCAFFAWEAARDAPSHCCLPSVIASVSVLATIFDVWCSWHSWSPDLGFQGRQNEKAERGDVDYREIWRSDPSMPAKTCSSAPVSREQKQIALQEWLVENSSSLLRSCGQKLRMLRGVDWLRRWLIAPDVLSTLQSIPPKLLAQNLDSHSPLLDSACLQKLSALPDRQTAFQLWADAPASPQAMTSLHWESRQASVPAHTSESTIGE